MFSYRVRSLSSLSIFARQFSPPLTNLKSTQHIDMSTPNYMFECTATNATLTSPCCVTANGTLNSANVCLNNGPGIFGTCAAPVDQQFNTTAINQYSSCRQTGGAGVLTISKMMLLGLGFLAIFANAR
jgi:hypothetical protein